MNVKITLNDTLKKLGEWMHRVNQLCWRLMKANFFYRKYNRRQWRQGHSVFGGIERGTGKCFLVEVYDHSAATLQAKIMEYILPGSHIMSDGWAGYMNLEQIGGAIYTHQVLVQHQNFVDPNDDKIHTQNVENLWMQAKRKFRRQYGMRIFLLHKSWQQRACITKMV